MNAEPTKQESDRYRSLYQFAYVIMGEVEVLKLGLDYKQSREYRNFINDLNPFQLGSVHDLTEEARQIIASWDSPHLEAWLRQNLPFVFQSIIYWQDSETTKNF